MVVFSFFLCQWHPRFVFWSSLSFDWCRTVVVDFFDALVATVSLGFGVFLEVYRGFLEQLEVMRFTWSEVRTDDLSVLLVDHYLAFGSMAFLLAGIVPPLSFFGRSTGDSLASIRTTSYSMSLLSNAFLPGR